MSKLKSLKEFEVERSALKNITGGLADGSASTRTFGAAEATCVNNQDDMKRWHIKDRFNGSSYEDVGLAWWGV